MIHIKAEDGENVLTFAPAKAYQFISYSSADLQKDAIYKLYLDDSSGGTENDDLYENGTYTSGTLYETFTISNMVTNIN